MFGGGANTRTSSTSRTGCWSVWWGVSSEECLCLRRCSQGATAARHRKRQASLRPGLCCLKCLIVLQDLAARVLLNCSSLIFMAALHSRCEHYILQLWFLSSSFFFFLTYSQRLQIVCLPYFHTWCGLSANLECRSEMCCTRLAENTGRKKLATNRHLRTIAQFCQAISSQLRHVSTVGKKLVKQQYHLHVSSKYGELRPTNGWDRLLSLGRTSKFHLVWPSPELVH